MPRVRVKTTSLKGFIKNQTVQVIKLGDTQTKQMADLTESAMKNNIQASITRANSSGNLSKSIFVSKIIGGYGVGKIDYLNENAPYWRHVNYGSTAIGASHSHRVPTGSFGGDAPTTGGAGQRWTVGTGNFSFIPGKPIAPLNYIGKTLTQIPAIIREVKG